jgi:hypothetical protein
MPSNSRNYASAIDSHQFIEEFLVVVADSQNVLLIFFGKGALLRRAAAEGVCGHGPSSVFDPVSSVASVLISTHEVGWPDCVVPPAASVWARGRKSAAPLAATELVFFATITRARCVTVGYQVLFGGRRRSLVRPLRRAAARRVIGNPPVHQWEHLLVSPYHGVDNGTPEIVEFLLVHLEAWPHFAKRLIPPVFR